MKKTDREQQDSSWKEQERVLVQRKEVLEKLVAETRQEADHYQEENERKQRILNQKDTEVENMGTQLQELETGVGACNAIVANMTQSSEEMRNDMNDLEARNRDLIVEIDRVQKLLRDHSEEAKKVKEKLEKEAKEKIDQLNEREKALEREEDTRRKMGRRK